jgi:DNA-binding response OmpR family regulator
MNASTGTERGSGRADLPISSSAPSVRVAPDKPIVVVDDEPDTRELLAQILSLDGFAVTCASSGLSLLCALRTEQPSAILLDVRMSWIDGFELCRALKQSPLYRHIPVIFISGCDEADVRERGLALGAIDYFVKPINIDRLLARLHEVTAAKDWRGIRLNE